MMDFSTSSVNYTLRRIKNDLQAHKYQILLTVNLHAWNTTLFPTKHS